MTKTKRFSYGFMFATLVAVVWLHLGTPLLAVLFSYFALTRLRVGRSKWLPVVLFLVLLSGVFYGFAYFLNQAFTALPNIISSAIPSFIRFAREQGLELPFDNLDSDSLKAMALDTVKTHLKSVANFARFATKEFAFLAMGVVVAISLFFNAKMDLGRDQHRLKNNLYSLMSDEIVERFTVFFQSFATVMGAQLLISTINTVLTAIFILSINLPNAEVVIGVTFLCGLLPIIGNLISNCIIVGIAITISPELALAALAFLILLHKGEYFLNSKIIGDRIKNPMWLTLMGLIIGERLMGVPGMILAPIILHYVKVETAQIAVAPGQHSPSPPSTAEEVPAIENIKVIR